MTALGVHDLLGGTLLLADVLRTDGSRRARTGGTVWPAGSTWPGTLPAVNRPTRLVIIGVTGLLLALSAGCASIQPESRAAEPAPAPSTVPPTAPPDPGSKSARVPAGQPIHIAGKGSAVAITVSDPKVIDPPEFWGAGKITVATVSIDATEGRYAFEETAFELVLADGTRVGASTVAADDGLPGRALGSGVLVAPDRATGLVTFDENAGRLDGARIQLRDDPDGRGWVLGGAPSDAGPLLSPPPRR